MSLSHLLPIAHLPTYFSRAPHGIFPCHPYLLERWLALPGDDRITFFRPGESAPSGTPSGERPEETTPPITEVFKVDISDLAVFQKGWDLYVLRVEGESYRICKLLNPGKEASFELGPKLPIGPTREWPDRPLTVALDDSLLIYDNPYESETRLAEVDWSGQLIPINGRWSRPAPRSIINMVRLNEQVLLQTENRVWHSYTLKGEWLASYLPVIADSRPIAWVADDLITIALKDGCLQSHRCPPDEAPAGLYYTLEHPPLADVNAALLYNERGTVMVWGRGQLYAGTPPVAASRA